MVFVCAVGICVRLCLQVSVLGRGQLACSVVRLVFTWKGVSPVTCGLVSLAASTLQHPCCAVHAAAARSRCYMPCWVRVGGCMCQVMGA